MKDIWADILIGGTLFFIMWILISICEIPVALNRIAAALEKKK
jgi:hypothetical protein